MSKITLWLAAATIAIVAGSVAVGCAGGPAATITPTKPAPVLTPFRQTELPASAKTFLEQLVAMAETSGGTQCALVEMKSGFVATADLQYLVSRLDSKLPCASVATIYKGKAYSKQLPGLSTEGCQAAYLLTGFRLNRYPPTNDSDNFNDDRDGLRAWWSLYVRGECGCAEEKTDGITPTGSTADRESKEDAIREALFLHLFDECVSYQTQNAPAYFLNVGENQDPSPQLFQRMKTKVPRVRPVSELEAATAAQTTYEPGVSIPGLLFRVTDIHWISDTSVTADGGYFEGRLSSSGGIYCLKLEAGHWVVAGVRQSWIS